MKEVIEQQVTYTRRDYRYTCSRCGKPCGEDEETRTFHVNHVEIELKSGHKIDLHVKEGEALALNISNIKHARIVHEEGTVYPDSANVQVTVVDACVECFLAHGIPALEAAGFKIRDESKDW